jgi:hypothetical protein
MAWQREACRPSRSQTTMVAPRQTGTSWTLSALAVWRAFRRPDQVVLIVSAGDSAAKRLLCEMRPICTHSLLAGPVVDESQTLLVLSKWQRAAAGPAAERHIRGWSVDLLIVDEAAFIGEELLHGAALPTTAARADARVVLASSPWSDSGSFFAAAMSGEPASEHFQTLRWRLQTRHGSASRSLSQQDRSSVRCGFELSTKVSSSARQTPFTGESAASSDVRLPAARAGGGV